MSCRPDPSGRYLSKNEFKSNRPRLPEGCSRKVDGRGDSRNDSSFIPYFYYMIRPEFLYTDSTHPEFQRLASELDKEIFIRDGEMAEANFELNKIGLLPHVVLLMEKNVAVACGALREFDAEAAELKRVYVMPSHRRKNLASMIMMELEKIALQQGYQYTVLETGLNQPEAIALYLKYGYEQVPKFGRYMESGNSVCFRKQL